MMYCTLVGYGSIEIKVIIEQIVYTLIGMVAVGLVLFGGLALIL